MPVTTPVLEPMVAVPVLALVHAPPDGVQLNVVVAPSHTTVVPLIAPGAEVTVTVLTAKQEPII